MKKAVVWTCGIVATVKCALLNSNMSDTLSAEYSDYHPELNIKVTFHLQERANYLENN